MILSASAQLVRDRQRRAFDEDGYFLLPEALSANDLALLRSECDRHVAQAAAQRAAEADDPQKSINSNGRYFLPSGWQENDRLRAFLLGDLMAEICRATIGDEAFLFWEQFTVKDPDPNTSFSWHQDSGYVGHPHRMYLTCWIALDDCGVDNGTISVLPYARGVGKKMVQHTWSEREKAFVGYSGDDPGETVLMPAGGIAVFSSLVLHRSGPNRSPRQRRAYVAQYSPEVIMNAAGDKPWGQSAPLLHRGQRVSAV